MKNANTVLKSIKNLFYRVFASRINYNRLYSSVWNKEKSNYLRRKIKGKKKISWREKRGGGSYFDKQLNRFVNPRLDGCDEEIKDIKKPK